MVSPCHLWRWLKQFFDTFVGQSTLFGLSGTYSFCVYYFSRNTLEQNFSKALPTGNKLDPSLLVTATLYVSFLTVFLSGYNVLTAHFAEWPGIRRLLTILPNDSHLSILTLLKAELLWLKTPILAFTNFDAVNLSWWVMLQQYLAIIFSVLLSTQSVYGFILYVNDANWGRDGVLNLYWNKALLLCGVLCGIGIQLLLLMLVFGKASVFFVSKSTFLQALHQVPPSEMLGLANIYTIPFLCFLLEMAAHLRVRLGKFTVSPCVVDHHSVLTGMRVLATYLVVFPGVIYIQYIAQASNQRIATLLTGRGSADGVEFFCLASPILTYTTIGLMLFAICAHIASGPPRTSPAEPQAPLL